MNKENSYQKVCTVSPSVFSKSIITDENLVKRNECLYVFENAIVKEKLIKKYYNDLLSKYFEAQKTLNLIQRKDF